MATSRREFLKLFGAVSAAGAAGAKPARASSTPGSAQQSWGMLTDLSLCIGCRKCEFACKQANGLPHGPLEEFEDKAVLEQKRRPDVNNITVVNRYPRVSTGEAAERSVHVKTQCMHCNRPACASACPVGAIKKTAEGPVVYDAGPCIGCRYCIMACPFSMPAYTYESPFAPAVRKCSMCFSTVSEKGGVPGCAKICPVEAITFGTRGKLLALAREKIRNHPDRYVDHVYGEHEVGGTCWLYLSPKPFSELGFRTDLGTTAYPELTEGFLSMVPLVVTIWPAVLAGAYALTARRGHAATASGGHGPNTPEPQKEHGSKGA